MANPSDKNQSGKQQNQEDFDPNQYELSDSDLQLGAMSDKLDMRRIIFWCVFGIVIFGVLLGGIYFVFNYNKFVSTERATIGSEHQQINRMKQESQEHLSSFGVLDDEEGIYHIPIDSAFTIYLDDQE